ncbi:MAG: DEAD/DEAH box helicase [Tissierellales bacterium]|jgi:superfamily II DNA/RNA helicase|nr:DEAD/DEAH box helicase [Tissierellales bacterium]
MSFNNLGLNSHLIDVLKSQRITEPTPIQSSSISQILNGCDVIAEAPTGSGKTLAFLLPIFQNIDSKNNHIQALIISPTRELALQIASEADKLNSDSKLNILCLFGGQNLGSQLKKLNRSIHLVIATPGRLLDHIYRENIDLSNVNTFVLDEADQMLYIGFKNEIEKLISILPKKKQFLCFSATLDSKVKKLAYRYMNSPVEISAKLDKNPIDLIEQQIILTSDRWKQEALFKVLDEENPFLAIIFCRTKRRVDDLDRAMAALKYNCLKLHGDMPQNARQRVMKAFRDVKIQYLIATDVAARGLDITGVTHIFNYDFPESSENYIHRIGRTGRMGKDGVAISFVVPRNEALLKEVEMAINKTLSKKTHDHNA